jgi:formylmethanofuran dehydrogenase subunit E
LSKEVKLRKVPIDGVIECEKCHNDVLAKDALMVSEVERIPKILCLRCALYYIADFTRHRG